MRYLFLTLSIFQCATYVQADSKPNVVIILCDDLGYGDLSIHGHPHIETPNLDNLAETGVRFTNFYSTAPVCSPSRVGLLTGRSPNRAGVYDWIPPSGKPRPDAREQVHMKSEEITIAHRLKEAGYATCMAGKWHCNAAFNSDAQPQPGDAGFDHWLATQNNAAPSHENPVNYVRNGQPVGPMKGFSCQIAADEVISWMRTHTKEDSEKPFFVFLPFHEPHEPVASPEDLVSKYRNVVSHEDRAQYYANVHNVDLAVGKVVSALKDMKLRDNTLVVFTSDNGPETLLRYRSAGRSWGTTAHLRGMKLHTHDGGFHVAGIMNWPKGIKPGQVVDAPVSALDLLPTACDLAAASFPKNRPLDGMSLVSFFRDGKMPTRTRPLIWTYYNSINHARVAMRHGKWKVLARLNGGKFPKYQNLTPTSLAAAKAAVLTDFEIYNVQSDPGETLNLAADSFSEKEDLLAQIRSAYADLVNDSPAWTPAK